MGIGRSEVSQTADILCEMLRNEMKAKIMAAYDALTQEERDEFAEDAGGYSNPNRVVRVLGMAVGNQVVSDRFDVESLKSKNRKAKRILNKRYFK